MLSPRQELILSKVVVCYQQTEAPVGSKVLSADPELNAGPSTIRNELAVLEEHGLLAHPHTSAGRVPTDAGYRYFVDRRPEGEDALRHAAGRGDDDDHQHLRLEREDLDVADRGRVQRGRGDDREQVRDLRERLRRRAHRLVDLAADELELEAPVAAGQRAALPRAEQAVDVEAVPGVGRDAARARVRMGEQPVLLEHGELVADRRRAGRDLGIGGERLRPDGQPGRRVGLDNLAQDQLLTR